MRYFPIFFDLKGRHVVVIGGGEEALRKVRLLLKTNARISVIAPVLHDELASEARVNWLAREFRAELIDDASLVYSAEPELNAAVSAAAKKRNIPVNTVDDAALSTFIVPSIVDRDPVVVAIGTEGTAPILGRGLRAKIDALLPQALGPLARAAAGLRPRVAESLPPGNRRRSFWQRYFFGDIRDFFIAGDKHRYSTGVENLFRDETMPSAGRVSLVGAGPGDPELLTLKTQRKLQEADVIVYDRLVNPAILEMARRDAVRVAVGKAPNGAQARQSDIIALLVREAKAGKIVVRLKGGDPSTLSHDSEEQTALKAEGIPVEIVPGIAAAPELGAGNHDWVAFARPGATFAIQLDGNSAGDISANLLDAGIDPATPVTIVENGSLPQERTFKTSIGSLWETVQLCGVTGPSTVYSGFAKAKVTADIVPFPVREDIRDAILRAAS
jgi:uroporphyrin-III C-methyltransferase/precorrin-2 dehydrogenase/sirohydrochlorin ferrochelatase